jgi:hypothetical protein
MYAVKAIQEEEVLNPNKFWEFETGCCVLSGFRGLVLTVNARTIVSTEKHDIRKRNSKI